MFFDPLEKVSEKVANDARWMARKRGAWKRAVGSVALIVLGWCILCAHPFFSTVSVEWVRLFVLIAMLLGSGIFAIGMWRDLKLQTQIEKGM